jgi:hypothetical protein
MIKLTVTEWQNLYYRLRQDYGNRIMIASVLKQDLGFSVRRHRDYSQFRHSDHETVCLDFYDDAKEIFFKLKYR